MFMRVMFVRFDQACSDHSDHTPCASDMGVYDIATCVAVRRPSWEAFGIWNLMWKYDGLHFSLRSDGTGNRSRCRQLRMLNSQDIGSCGEIRMLFHMSPAQCLFVYFSILDVGKKQDRIVKALIFREAM